MGLSIVLLETEQELPEPSHYWEICGSEVLWWELELHQVKSPVFQYPPPCYSIVYFGYHQSLSSLNIDRDDRPNLIGFQFNSGWRKFIEEDRPLIQDLTWVRDYFSLQLEYVSVLGYSGPKLMEDVLIDIKNLSIEQCIREAMEIPYKERPRIPRTPAEAKR